MDLEGSTCRDPSRFEYEAKERRTGKESQGNIHAKKKKSWDQGNGSCQKKSKPKPRRIKHQLIAWALIKIRTKYKELG